MHVFMTSCPGADPGFFLGRGAPQRNDFNFVSYLLLLLFLDRILLILENHRSSQATPAPFHFHWIPCFFQILNAFRQVDRVAFNGR